MNPELLAKALEAIKAGDGDAAAAILEQLIVESASGGAPPPATEGSETLAETPELPPTEEEKAALAALRRATGAENLGEACKALDGLVARLSKIDGEQATLDTSARLSLVGDLVKLGAETPATAWEGDPKDRKPVARLSAEPLDALRTRVKALSAGKGAPATAKKPPGSVAPVAKLSKIERDYCKKNGLTEAEYTEKKNATVRRA